MRCWRQDIRLLGTLKFDKRDKSIKRSYPSSVIAVSNEPTPTLRKALQVNICFCGKDSIAGLDDLLPPSDFSAQTMYPP